MYSEIIKCFYSEITKFLNILWFMPWKCGINTQSKAASYLKGILKNAEKQNQVT